MRSIIPFCLVSLFYCTNLFCQAIQLAKQENQWANLVDDIGNDSIVCLGEESHWIETYLELKNSIIKRLHQQKQFDVVIFESGFVNSFMAIKSDLQSNAKLMETLYPLWQTKSTQDLIHYFDTSQNTSNPIIQLGCDLKGPVSFRFSRFLKSLFKTLGNETYGIALAQLNSNFIVLRHHWEPEIGKAHRGIFLAPAHFDTFYKGYSVATDSVIANKKRMIEKQLLTPIEIDFLIKCLENRKNLLELMQLPSYPEKHKYRDAIMAENINWFIEKFIPHHKYLIWGADIHISKDAKWEDAGEAWATNRSMIEVLMEKQDKQIFSLGIKPRKSFDKKTCKQLKIDFNNYYVNLKKVLPKLGIKFREEHEAVIIVGKTKNIKRFKIDKHTNHKGSK